MFVLTRSEALQAINKPLSPQEEAVIVSVNKDGQVFISDYEVQVDSLGEKLLEILEGRESREVFLNADKSVPYGVVTRVMSEIKAAGIEKLGMVTEPEAALSTFSEPKEEVLLVSSEPIAQGAGESASSSNPASNAQSGIYLNMVDTDITALIENISEITGKTFIVDSNVKGKVNVVSREKITKDEAYRLFQSVLEVNGYALVPSGNVIKVVPASEARTKSIEIKELGMVTETEAAASDSKASTGMTGKGKPTSDTQRIYYSEVAFNIQRNWAFSDQMTSVEKDLYNEVVIKIQRNGTIEDIWFDRRSGNSYFDDSTRRAILESSPLPPIPDGISGTSLTLALRFTPERLK